MTKTSALIVAALMGLTSITPAMAFTPGGTAADLSAKYGNMPSWQPATAERGDSIYLACTPAMSAGVSWRQCLLAFVAENQDKFPARFQSESDFFLSEGAVYSIPVFAGGAAAPANPAAATLPTRADYLAIIDILRQFEAKIDGDMVTEAEMATAINAALAAAAQVPGNNGLAALETELATQADRLTAIEETLAEQVTVNTDTAAALAALERGQADQATVNTETATALATLETNQARTVGVVTALDGRVAATETVAAQAAADAAAAKAAAERAEAALAAGLAQGGAIDTAIDTAVDITDPQNAIGNALEGKVDDSELTTAGVSIWTWVFGTLAGLVALALLGLIGFSLNRRKVNQVATQVAEVEDRAGVVETHVTDLKSVLIPSELDVKLALLAKGDAEYTTAVQVDGVNHELGFTWAEPQYGRPQVTVRGIKDQFEPINVANIRSRILRAAGKGHIEGLAASAPAFARAQARAAAHAAAPTAIMPLAPPAAP